MKFSRFGMVMGVAAMMLVGCADSGMNGTGMGGMGGMGTKQTIGTGVGAIGGGLLGSQIGGGSGRLWATGAGVLLGALAGSSVGKSLDKADMAYAQSAQAKAYSAPVGQTINWNNPQSGNSGSYTTVRDGSRANGQYCREYTQTIKVGGQTEQGTGTACQNPDGSWQIVN